MINEMHSTEELSKEIRREIKKRNYEYEELQYRIREATVEPPCESTRDALIEILEGLRPVSYTHLTLPTNREV